ncbi:MAG: type II secretion system protein GspN [Nitrospirae bacterium]|nr:type II secretion system protein GspN [Nitrospirota bacterium]
MTVKWPDEWKEILAWTVGGVCVLVLCMMATFPFGALHARLVAELNRATGMEVRVADWAVGLPLGLEWRNITLSKPDWGPIQLAFLQTKVGIVKGLSGGLGLDVVVHLDEASPNAGLAKGTLTASSFSLAGPVAVKGQLQQVDLSKVLRRYVSHGVLNGDFSHRVDSGQATVSAMKGEGTWKADATDLAIDQIPLGNGRTLSLAFNKVSAGLVCRDIVCDITELKGDGIDGSFTGEGKITIQQPLQNTQLALTVTVVPGVGFTSKANTLGLPPLPPGTPMTVKVVGTLAQARIAL